MEKGLVLALFASVSFAACAVIVRNATARTGESFTPMAVSVLVGIPYFTAALFFTAEWSELRYVSWQAFALLGGAGIIHFVAGRQLSYNAYRLIGANKATPFITTSPFYTVIIGVLFLRESLTVIHILGILCVFAGAGLISMERKSVSEERQEVFLSAEIKGILLALGGAICWGTSPVLVKLAVAEVASPHVRAFISYAAAAIVTALLLLRKEHRQQMVKISPAAILVPIVISGILASTGQLFSYTAIFYSAVSKISPLMSTQVLFILLFSFLLNRHIEVFTPKVILGMAATVAGTFFIFQ
jgi:drug/metabolite transporter (DMT)-like permease